MKKNYILKVLLLSFFMIFSTYSYSQITLYSQDFEGTDFDTYQLLNSGGSSVGFSTTGIDYIVRATPASLPLGNTVTGFSGNVIALEDHDGAGFSGQHSINTNAINISGASGIALKIRLAAPRGSDGNRYESADFLQVQISVDGGGFQTVINTGGTSTNNNYYYDALGNGITGTGDDILVNQASQEIEVTVAETGSSLVVRVLFDSQGPQEEILFDDIVVEAAMVIGVEETKLENSVELYPNPSNGNLIIKNSTVVLQSATITDINGRTVATIPLSGVVQDESLSLNLKSGVYFMQLNSDTATTTKKLIIN
ncbi:MAG: T9SS type A sorting domain-containing protein [Kordia sp.]|uniref:T9SS type A sorting domain-containing protein n=1 Tax=Kordia sp. TaxID=1965332 RepID=UPI00385AB5B2